MFISMTPELEAALKEEARRRGIAPHVLAFNILYERLFGTVSPLEPRDEWERQLLSLGIDCGVCLPNEAVSSEGLYD
jgi:hypothetical protein